MTLWRCKAVLCLLSILGFAATASADITPISQNRFVLSQAFIFPTNDLQFQRFTASDFGIFDALATHTLHDIATGASSTGYAEQYSIITPNFLNFSGRAQATVAPVAFNNPLQWVYSFFTVTFALYEPHNIVLNFSGSSTIHNENTHTFFTFSNDTQYLLSQVSDIPSINQYELFLEPGTYHLLGMASIGHNETGISSIDLSLVATPVPEPGTWALMLTGLALVVFGYSASRQKTKTENVDVIPNFSNSFH